MSPLLKAPVSPQPIKGFCEPKDTSGGGDARSLDRKFKIMYTYPYGNTQFKKSEPARSKQQKDMEAWGKQFVLKAAQDLCPTAYKGAKRGGDVK